MSKDEALRLALEALEKISRTQYHIETPPIESLEKKMRRIADQAITTIKAALEAKDEPVAWRDAAIRLGEELSSVGPDGYYDMDAKEWLDWAIEQNPRGKHSLPQRTWVGLTDEDLKLLSAEWRIVYGAWMDDFAKDIEAKLKEKNT